jgi:NosR/NirI family nitrous oxide reductase transcriptional regulator
MDQQSFRLPVVELSANRAVQARLAWIVHAGRVLTLLLLLVGLHQWANQQLRRSGRSAPVTIDIDRLTSLIENVAAVEAIDSQAEAFRVRDANAKTLAIVTQTSPHADAIIGYAGPSNLLIVMDDDMVVKSIRILRCPDTAEHLRMVENDQKFWQQFVGWKWGETAKVKVDGVSGSTLTSLAIGESVAWRLSHPVGSVTPAAPSVRPSLRFPAPIAVEPLRRWFETATSVRPIDDSPFLWECLDETGTVVGKVIRSGPLDDSVVGYQGPTEVILQVAWPGDAADQASERTGNMAGDEAATHGAPTGSPVIVDAMLGETFDNQPYVNYVKQERSFWKRFRNRSLESLATLDLEAEMIDGVSGATMTSLAVAETIRNACQKWSDLIEQRTFEEAASQNQVVASGGPSRQRAFNTAWREWLTGGIAIAALFFSRSRWRGRRWYRLVWQITMLVAIGMISGNLLSLALLGGWTRGGIAWRFAPGLTVLAAVALLSPLLFKGNVYCDHICPHGILQQWIRPQKGRQIVPFFKALMVAATVGLIALALLSVIAPTTIHLAWLEPFDLYASGVLFSVSAAVWCLSLVLARLTPMGYCRLACPTGRLLDFVRRDASRHRLTVVDGALLISTLAVWAAWWGGTA